MQIASNTIEMYMYIQNIKYLGNIKAQDAFLADTSLNCTIFFLSYNTFFRTYLINLTICLIALGNSQLPSQNKQQLKPQWHHIDNNE